MGREPMPLMSVISLLQQEAGNHLDSGVVRVFLRCLPQALLLYRGEHFPPEYMDETLHRFAPGRLFGAAGLLLL